MKIRQVLNEAAGITASFAFGRFNPAHQGHVAVWQTVEKSGVKWYIGTNPTTIGPNDPLTFEQKKAWMEEIYPQIQGHIVPEQSVVTLAVKIFNDLGQNEDSTIGYVTDETDWAWSGKLLNQYNGVEGKHGYYKFAQIVHIPSPRVSSATALRDAARAGDKAAFYHASGTDPKLKVAGKTYFDTVAEACAKYPLPVKKAKKESVAEAWGYNSSKFTNNTPSKAGRDAERAAGIRPSGPQRLFSECADMLHISVNQLVALAKQFPGFPEVRQSGPNKRYCDLNLFKKWVIENNIREVIASKGWASSTTVAEMDSQGYTGSRDKKSLSKYGSRDDYELGQGKEYTGKSVKSDEVGKTALDILNKEMEKSHKKDVNEAAGNIGNQIKSLYQKIADQGDDAIEFMYYDSPIFAQYWDEYEGDLDSIIAEVDPSDLQVILAELTSAAEDQGIAEADQLPGTPVVSLSDFDDKDNKKNKYGQTVPKKLNKDDPRVKFHKDPKQGVAEGWKEKAASAALAGTMAMGGQAHAGKFGDSVAQGLGAGMTSAAISSVSDKKRNARDEEFGKQIPDEEDRATYLKAFKRVKHSRALRFSDPSMMGANAVTEINFKKLKQEMAEKYNIPMPVKEQDVAEASNKVHLRTPKHGLADHAGRDTGVSKFKFGQTPEKDRCPKCHDLYRKHYKQGIEEASLATMRDYFAGNEDAEDPMKITQMRDFYKKQGDLPNKKKEFRSEWEYQQWLKKNKMINMNKSPVKEELKQNWVQKVMERKK